MVNKQRVAAPQAVADWITQIVDEAVEERAPKTTDPKNLDVQSICPSFPEQFPMFIEISKGSHEKYEWDVKHNIMILDRVLSSAVFYPYDYGFIPQTLCEDGDPLDVILLGSNPLIPGVVCRARAIGFLDFEDVSVINGVETYVGDEKVLAVLVGDPIFESYNDLNDVPVRQLEMIKEFFKNYKNLEAKTKLKPRVDKGYKGKKEAIELVQQTHINFTKKLEATLAERQQ